MSAQFDLISGVDISALSSVTASQILQAINQVTPLNHIGLTLYGSTEPDVDENPRYVRYGWLDTTTSPPTFKVWDDSESEWVAGVVGAGAINDEAQIAAGTIPITKFKVGSGTSLQLIRVNTGATGWEFVDLSTLLATNNVLPLNAINLTGSSPSLRYMRRNTAGALEWAAIDPDVDITDGTLPIDKLVVGANKSILRMSAAGVVEWVANTDNTIIGTGGLLLSSLAQSSANSNDTIRWSGSAWVPSSTGLTNKYETAVGAHVTFTSADGTTSFTHGLGATPKLVRVVLVCQEADGGCAVGDELDVTGVFANTAGGDGEQSFSVVSNSTLVKVGWSGLAHKIQDPLAGTDLLLTETKWKIKAYAWV